MLQTALYLIYIYWRKFFVKGDYLSLGILLTILTLSLIGIYQTYTENYYFLFVFLLIPISHHFNRNDFVLLQNTSKHKVIIFLEYFFNSLTILLIFSVKQDFLYAFISVLVLVILVFLPQKSLKIKYPFSVFDPFWIISFRKYKLIFLLPVILFLMIMGKIYDNENLILFSFGLVGILATIPYFEREFKAHIVSSAFKKEVYLEKQIRCGIKNFLLLSFPFILLIISFLSWEILIFSLGIVLLPLLGILTKYAFFENTILQSIVFTLILANYSFGLPIICLPFLYHQAVKKVKKIQNVTN